MLYRDVEKYRVKLRARVVLFLDLKQDEEAPSRLSTISGILRKSGARCISDRIFSFCHDTGPSIDEIAAEIGVVLKPDDVVFMAYGIDDTPLDGCFVVRQGEEGSGCRIAVVNGTDEQRA